MRGSDHDAHRYRMWITRGGLRVEKEALLRGGLELGGAPPSLLLKGVRVLLVEDFDEARECIRLVLEQQGAEVIQAATGKEAMEAVASVVPNVVVCDMGLPDEGRYALLPRL